MVAQYKTGKTSLAINLYRSLVNRDPFLGAYTVHEVEGRVAYFDYEMLESSSFRGWLRVGGELDMNKMVTPYHLRGQILPLWDKMARAKVVDWLKRNDTTAIIIDTAARAWAGLVDNENSNSEILRFTDSLDQLQYEAGIVDLFLLTHMGRQAAFMPEGQERARGATRLEGLDGYRLVHDQGRGGRPLPASHRTRRRSRTDHAQLRGEHSSFDNDGHRSHRASANVAPTKRSLTSSPGWSTGPTRPN